MSHYFKKCPSCSEMIGSKLDKCPYCGSSVDVDVAVDPASAPVDGSMYSGTDSDQTPLAYYLAAGVLLLGTLIYLAEVLVAVVAGESVVARNIVSLIVDIGLMIALFRLHDDARKWVIVRAALGLLIYPVMVYFESKDVLLLVIVLVVQLAYSGSLLLLLTGKSQPWRLVVASAVFVTFGFLPMLATLVLYFLATTLSS